MNIEEQMQWDGLRDRLDELFEVVRKIDGVNWTLLFGRLQSLDEQYAAVLEWQRQVDRRLTDIESRLGELANHVMADKKPGEPGPSFVVPGTIYINGVPIQAGDKITVEVPPRKQTFIAAAEPANRDTRDGEYSSHLMAGPFKSSPVLPVCCNCGPHEYCERCNPEEFKHGPK